MKCEYCDHERDMSHQTDALSAPVAHALDELLQGTSSRGWGRTTRSLKCRNCSATVAFSERQAPGRCVYCGSDAVTDGPSDDTLIAPETVIPFQVDREAAVARFREWVGRQWFCPGVLKRKGSRAEIDGVYLPFFTFSALAQSRWTATSGYHYQENDTYVDDQGHEQTGQVKRTRWMASSGQHERAYDDIHVCASTGLPEAVVHDLEPFHTAQAQVYRPEVLATEAAEAYGVVPVTAWRQGHATILHHEYADCHQAVPGDEHRELNVATRLEKVAWKHVLVPVWIAAYQYHGKTYRFLVNGETGQTSGKAPVSWSKVALLVVVVLAVLVAVTCMGLGARVPSQHANARASAIRPASGIRSTAHLPHGLVIRSGRRGERGLRVPGAGAAGAPLPQVLHRKRFKVHRLRYLV